MDQDYTNTLLALVPLQACEIMGSWQVKGTEEDGDFLEHKGDATSTLIGTYQPIAIYGYLLKPQQASV